MKFRFDRKYLKICLYAFFTIAALMVFYRMLQSSTDIWRSVSNGISYVLALLSPFITAILIAYLLSPAVSGVERLLGKIFRKPSQLRGRRLFSLVFVYAAVVAVITVTLSFIIPSIVKSIRDIIVNWEQYQKSLQGYYNDFLKAYPLFAGNDVQNFINNLLADIGNSLNVTAKGVTDTVFGILSSVFGFIIALLLSLYLLNERPVLVSGFNRLLQARFGEKRADAVMDFLRSVDRVFGRYISAKLLVCIILIVIGIAVFSLLGLRYAVLMAVIVSLSTLVPYIGPFLGAVPPIVVALLDSPEKALYTGISILAIHVVDGYFIEPFIFSDRLGLSPFWILFSIILGGGLFGIWGMLFAVPVAAVLKLLIVKYIRIRRERQKKESNDDSKPQE